MLNARSLVTSFSLLALLAASTPSRADEGTPPETTPPAEQAAPVPAATEEAPASTEGTDQGMPPADATTPAAEPTPAPAATPAAAPAAAPAAKPAEKVRRFGALAVFGIGAMALGTFSLVLSGASLLSPFAVGQGFQFIENDTDGIPLGTSGRSINPFMALGSVTLLTGVVLGAVGVVLLGLEWYLNM